MLSQICFLFPHCEGIRRFGNERPEPCEEFLIEIEQVDAQNAHSQCDEPRHGHVSQEVRAHAQARERRHGAPAAAEQIQERNAFFRALFERRQQRPASAAPPAAR